jgi:hypothetical protein
VHDSQPLYNDYRKLRVRNGEGTFQLSHVDEFVDEMLTKDFLCNIALPRIPTRWTLEASTRLEPRISALEDFEELEVRLCANHHLCDNCRPIRTRLACPFLVWHLRNQTEATFHQTAEFMTSLPFALLLGGCEVAGGRSGAGGSRGGGAREAGARGDFRAGARARTGARRWRPFAWAACPRWQTRR